MSSMDAGTDCGGLNKCVEFLYLIAQAVAGLVIIKFDTDNIHAGDIERE